ncbi:FecR family protein [Xylanibacter oryzae]|uniref:FecR family protein n=1 Tax=Xylanibacter oryzae TaxID=185293 RepID=UPI0004B188A1|nr:FecR domain-containing protein [Xylanibacter oryzae]
MKESKEDLFNAVESIEKDEPQSDDKLKEVSAFYNSKKVSDRIHAYQKVDTDAAYCQFLSKVHSYTTHFYWKYAAVVAVAAMLLITFFIVYPHYTRQQHSPEVTAMLKKKIPALSDSLPMIRLANGKVIVLSKSGQSLAQAGLSAAVGQSSIALNAEGNDVPVEMLELVIPRGRQYQVSLPDGSMVNLNSGSTLRFPNRFTSRRDVYLRGEAYFEVKKDGRPFRVTCPAGAVNVLGTTFNVRAYSSDNACIALYTGKVRYENNGHDVELSPGEQIVKTGNEISVNQIYNRHTAAWKDGLIYFTDDNLGDVMDDIERIYDVKVVFQRDIRSIRFTGECKRTESVEDFMKVMGLTKEFGYEIQNKTITIK